MNLRLAATVDLKANQTRLRNGRVRLGVIDGLFAID